MALPTKENQKVQMLHIRQKVKAIALHQVKQRELPEQCQSLFNRLSFASLLTWQSSAEVTGDNPEHFQRVRYLIYSFPS